MVRAVDELPEMSPELQAWLPTEQPEPPEVQTQRRPMVLDRVMGGSHNTRIDTRKDARIRGLIDTKPISIMGQNGSGTLLWVISDVSQSFDLTREETKYYIVKYYNPRCEPPWSEKEIDHKIEDAFEKPLSSIERGRYLKDETPNYEAEIDLSELCSSNKNADKTDELTLGRIDDPGPFPLELLEVPGYVGEVADFINRSAFVRQPVLALASAITLLATLIGRYFKTKRSAYSNVMVIGVGSSSTGKENTRSVPKAILERVGLVKRIRENYASYQAIPKDLANGPRIWYWDEMGKFLPGLNDTRQTHLSGIFPLVMRLYSSANSVFVADYKANDTEPLIIDHPHLVLYATSTPRELYNALTIDQISDGFLARCHFFEADEKAVRPDVFMDEVPEIPASILDSARWWAERPFNPTEGRNLESFYPKPRTVPQDEEANEVFTALLVEQNRMMQELQFPLNALWGKVVQQADQLALVYSVSVNREEPVIDRAAATWACDLVRYLTKRKICLADGHISISPFDKKQKEIINFIKDNGGTVTQSVLVRRFQRMSLRERNELFENMLSTGQAFRVTQKGKTKPIYVWTTSPEVASEAESAD